MTTRKQEEEQETTQTVEGEEEGALEKGAAGGKAAAFNEYVGSLAAFDKDAADATDALPETYEPPGPEPPRCETLDLEYAATGVDEGGKAEARERCVLCAGALREAEMNYDAADHDKTDKDAAYRAWQSAYEAWRQADDAYKAIPEPEVAPIEEASPEKLLGMGGE